VPAGRANNIRGDPGGHASAPRQWQAGTMTGAGEEKLGTLEEETHFFSSGFRRETLLRRRSHEGESVQ
jgi:hypothetical protein